MSRRWVVNASPLILLGKAGYAGLLYELSDELIIPEAVAREVGAKPDGRGVLDNLRSSSSVRFESPVAIPNEIAVWDLGEGESAVLAFASASTGNRVVVDDLEARRCAQVLALSVIGTLGVVLRAKRQGLIPRARPVVENLLRSGLYVSDGLFERALAHLGE